MGTWTPTSMGSDMNIKKNAYLEAAEIIAWLVKIADKANMHGKKILFLLDVSNIASYMESGFPRTLRQQSLCPRTRVFNSPWGIQRYFPAKMIQLFSFLWGAIMAVSSPGWKQAIWW